jgi:hypothetical protein
LAAHELPDLIPGRLEHQNESIVSAFAIATEEMHDTQDFGAHLYWKSESRAELSKRSVVGDVLD